jgi:hypothetical protein
MVTFHVNGQRFSWAEAEAVIAELPVTRHTVEVRDAAGRVICHILPPPEEPTPLIVEDDPR